MRQPPAHDCAVARGRGPVCDASRAGSWRWERVCQLTVRVGLRTRDRPIVGNRGCRRHADRQAWVPLKSGSGPPGAIVEPSTPSSAQTPGSGGSRSGTAVLLGHPRASVRCDWRVRHCAAPVQPRAAIQVAERASPTVGGASDRGSGTRESLDILTESNGNDAWTQLRDTEIRGLKGFIGGNNRSRRCSSTPARYFSNFGLEAPRTFLDHDGARPHDAIQAQSWRGKRSRSSSGPSCFACVGKGGRGTPPATRSTPAKS